MDPIAFRRHEHRRRPRWLRALDAAARSCELAAARSRRRTCRQANVVTGRGFGIGTPRHRRIVGGRGRHRGQQEDRQDHRQAHLQRDRRRARGQPGAASRTRWSAARSWASAARCTRSVAFNKTRVTSLDWVTYPILRFKDAPKITNVVVQRPDKLAARRRRAAVLPDPGGDRERVLRRDRRAHPRGADDAGARTQRPQGGGSRLSTRARRGGRALRGPRRVARRGRDVMAFPSGSLAILVGVLLAVAAPVGAQGSTSPRRSAERSTSTATSSWSRQRRAHPRLDRSRRP